MEKFEIELQYTITAIKKVEIEAKTYKQALKKFKKEYGIGPDENTFDGMATGPELDLNECMDSIEVEIWDYED